LELSEISHVIIISGFGLVQAVTVAVIAGLFNRESKKRKATDEKMEKRSAIRAEESRLAMQLMSANARLASATGLAVKEGRANGKMDIALLEAEKAQSEYYSFINRVASTQMTAD
jgi:hypothetical protein